MGTTFNPVILRFDSLPSTNTEAARHAVLGAAEGLCVVAREQTSGRGRMQRAWASPKDAGLYASIILRPRVDMSVWPLITLLAAVAVHDALIETCGLRTDIKWPNDIYSSGRKLCGILAETVDTKVGRAVVVGIGVNLTSGAIPAELRDSATSVEEEAEVRIDDGSLLRHLLASLQKRYEAFQSEGGESRILEEWTRRSSYAEGKRVRVLSGEESFKGTTRGLAGDGALRVETDAGQLKTIRAGDIISVREEKSG